MTEPVIFPFIHEKGTKREILLSQQMAILEASLSLLEAINLAEPKIKDYIVRNKSLTSGEVWQKVNKQHKAKLDKVKTIRDMTLDVIHHIKNI